MMHGKVESKDIKMVHDKVYMLDSVIWEGACYQRILVANRFKPHDVCMTFSNQRLLDSSLCVDSLTGAIFIVGGKLSTNSGVKSSIEMTYITKEDLKFFTQNYIESDGQIMAIPKFIRTLDKKNKVFL